MTLKLELTPEEEKRLAANARAQGKTIDEYLHRLIAQTPESPAPSEYEATMALFSQWDAEDATDNPEEIARRLAEWEQFKANMNANRALEGRPPVYP